MVRNMIEATIFSFVRDEGTIVVFGATRVDNGRTIYIGIEHRFAQDIVRALDYEEPTVNVDEWQIIGDAPVPPEMAKLREIAKAIELP